MADGVQKLTFVEGGMIHVSIIYCAVGRGSSWILTSRTAAVMSCPSMRERSNLAGGQLDAATAD
jgi:hypothetical protein